MLKISKDRNSRASLGNPFQYLITPAVNVFFLRSTQNSSCCNLWLSLCNSDNNTQLHLLLSLHVGSRSGITSHLILLQAETNLSLSLCIKHSHPLSSVEGLDGPPLHLLQYVNISPVPDVDSRGRSHVPWPAGYLFAYTTQYACVLFSTLHTFHRSLTYLTGFLPIHVRWCNLGRKKQAGGSVT